MYNFIVHILDKEVEVNKLVICRGKEELIKLLLNIEDKYVIAHIDVVFNEIVDNCSDLLKTDNNKV